MVEGLFPIDLGLEEWPSLMQSRKERFSAASLAGRELRAKMDAAALAVLETGRDWGEGPIECSNLPDAFSTHSLWDQPALELTQRGGPVDSDWVPPHGWRVIRHADWVAAGYPGRKPTDG